MKTPNTIDKDRVVYGGRICRIWTKQGRCFIHEGHHVFQGQSQVLQGLPQVGELLRKQLLYWISLQSGTESPNNVEREVCCVNEILKTGT